METKFEDWKREIKKQLPYSLQDYFEVKEYEDFCDIWNIVETQQFPELKEIVLYLRHIKQFKEDPEKAQNSYYYSEDIQFIRSEYILENLLYQWILENNIKPNEENTFGLLTLTEEDSQKFKNWVNNFNELVEDGLDCIKTYTDPLIFSDYDINPGIEYLFDSRDKFITIDEYKKRWRYENTN